MTRALLRLTASKHTSLSQNAFWAGVSHSLTKLSFDTEGPVDPLRMDLLSQLYNLTTLTIVEYGCPHSTRGRDSSYLIKVPGLQTLDLFGVDLDDLTLECPKLGSLIIRDSWIRRRLMLKNPLANFSSTGGSGRHAALATSILLGLTSLQWSLPYESKQETFYNVLPLMSRLRSLDLFIDREHPCSARRGDEPNHLPTRLPNSLQTIRYVLKASARWCPRDAQSFAEACQLPELESISLISYMTSYKWTQDDLRAFEDIKVKTKAKVIIRQNLN